MDDSWYHEVWPHPRNASAITRLELITGWSAGIDERAPDINEVDSVIDPVAALERALLPAVATSPCCVAFSGGRDSSVLLALATRVARREGLDDPVPVTVRFSGLPESDETEWQMDVVRRLRLNEWKVVRQADDLDLVGSEWRRSFDENGLVWPPAAHALQPLQRAARGGALVHGDGGDQVFAGWGRAAISQVLRGQRRFRARDARALIRSYGPTPVRRAIEVLRADTPAPWLIPAARRAWARHQGWAAAVEPRTWPEFLRWARRERETYLMLQTLERQTANAGARLYTPLWDPVFLRSLGHWGGRLGRGRRTAMMTALFPGMLPEHVLRRGTKAHFTRAFFSDTSRRFARGWHGPIPEPAVVRREPLRAAWLSKLPPNTCAVLLQASWVLANQI